MKDMERVWDKGSTLNYNQIKNQLTEEDIKHGT